MSMKVTTCTFVTLAFGMLGAAAAPAHAANEPEAEVTYYQDVLPIMQENCQTCHRPSGKNVTKRKCP